MKYTTLFTATLGVAASAATLPGLIKQVPGSSWASGLAPSSEQYLIQLAAGETRWIYEEEKWELRRVS